MGSIIINFITVTTVIFATILKSVVANQAENFSYSDIALRITGGEIAKDGEFPYVAGIFSINKHHDQFLCGGALISTSFVLTAAHCLHEQESANVILGARNLYSNAVEPAKQTFSSTHFFIHPNYAHSEKTPTNDLALIKLPQPAILNNHVQIIHIPKNDKQTYAGKTGTCMGWGDTCTDAKTPNVHALLHQNNTILTNAGCRKSYPYLKKALLDTNICLSGKGGKSICDGDSGGPLVVNKVLVGVLSIGHPKCGEGHACAFTRNVVAPQGESFSSSDVVLRIFGGSEATDAQFPYLAGIFSTNKQQRLFVCGGSLISTRAVLAAGHCLHAWGQEISR